MSFLRPKVKQPEAVAAPSPVVSPTDLLGSLVRRRRMMGGRNSFAPSQTSSAAGGAVGAAPATVTGVQS